MFAQNISSTQECAFIWEKSLDTYIKSTRRLLGRVLYPIRRVALRERGECHVKTQKERSHVKMESGPSEAVIAQEPLDPLEAGKSRGRNKAPPKPSPVLQVFRTVREYFPGSFSHLSFHILLWQP